jgi:hypothetical protein
MFGPERDAKIGGLKKLQNASQLVLFSYIKLQVGLYNYI